jgi:hypothetical protein
MHAEGHKHTNTQHPDRCDLASIWAARTLITPAAFLHAAKGRPLIADVARELSVTPHDVETYLGSLSVDDFRVMRSLVGHALV